MHYWTQSTVWHFEHTHPECGRAQGRLGGVLCGLHVELLYAWWWVVPQLVGRGGGGPGSQQ